MRLKRTELKQIAAEIWRNGESYFLDGSKLLKKFQETIKICGPKLHDSTEIELNEQELATVEEVKKKLSIK
jgi:hypothetical protein